MIRKNSFTLVEMLASMAILVILMGFLFQFLSSAQRAWSLIETNTRIYENARVAMDLITRDLQCAVASDVDGEEIPFYYNTTDQLPTFVSATSVPYNEAANSKLCEVYYSTSGDTLKRQCVGDLDSGWNFYGNVSGWQTNASTTTNDREIIDGVKELKIACYTYNTSTLLLEEISSGSYTKLPDSAVISLTLVNPSIPPDITGTVLENIEKKTKRTFTKIVTFGR
jgi:type II secretory pathway component PulJ